MLLLEVPLASEGDVLEVQVWERPNRSGYAGESGRHVGLAVSRLAGTAECAFDPEARAVTTNARYIRRRTSAPITSLPMRLRSW